MITHASPLARDKVAKYVTRCTVCICHVSSSRSCCSHPALPRSRTQTPLPSHSLPFSRQTNCFAGGLASFYLYCLFQHQRCALRHNIMYCSFTPTLGKVDSTSSKGASRSPLALDFSSSARCSGWSTRITSLDSKLEVSRIHLWILN